MKKRICIITSILICTIVLITIGIKSGIRAYEKAKEEEKIKNAVIEVELSEDLTAKFASKKKVSDYVTSLNGKIIDDHMIDTTELGTKKVQFDFINEDDIKIPYSYEIEVKDTTPPLVWLFGDYYVTTAFTGTLESKILCADDYDDEPVCKVEGEYDTKKVGTYKLNFKAYDSSGNVTDIPFNLHVSKPSQGGSTYTPNPDKFSEFAAKYEDEHTFLGIDVSSWQGDIDFQKVKNAGVKFAFVRVGSKWGADGDYFLDSKFERNMKGFMEVGIPIGAYFYSYARNEQEAKEEAEWLIEKLEDYKIDLPIAFDFEDWSRYNDYKMSLYRLNRNAEVFIETLEKAGYEGMLYSSINYLNRVWDTDGKIVWGAHYTTKADYRGKFDYWQISSEGIVDGIQGFVDLDIMYK